MSVGVACHCWRSGFIFLHKTVSTPMISAGVLVCLVSQNIYGMLIYIWSGTLRLLLHTCANLYITLLYAQRSTLDNQAYSCSAMHKAATTDPTLKLKSRKKPVLPFKKSSRKTLECSLRTGTQILDISLTASSFSYTDHHRGHPEETHIVVGQAAHSQWSQESSKVGKGIGHSHQST